VCIVPAPTGSNGNCDPCGTAVGGSCDAGALYGCDSSNLDLSTSPGLCVAYDPQFPAADQGTCLPKCQIPADGSAATGCVGNDTCVSYAWVSQANGSLLGVGFCSGSCQGDSDCLLLGSGWGCQIDIGFCTQAKVARTKAIGQGCGLLDSSSGACNCAVDPSTGIGYCTSACVIGGVACADGYVCNAFYPVGPPDAGTSATQNPGLSGSCYAPCSGACPSNSICQQTSVGQECIP
jgi:hypothetical protein